MTTPSKREIERELDDLQRDDLPVLTLTDIHDADELEYPDDADDLVRVDGELKKLDPTGGAPS